MLTLSDPEVLELYRYFRYTYVSPNHNPALTALLARVDARAAVLCAEHPEQESGHGCIQVCST